MFAWIVQYRNADGQWEDWSHRMDFIHDAFRKALRVKAAGYCVRIKRTCR